MSSNAYLLLIILCVLLFCVSGNGVYAFGAGNIPSFAYLEGKAFRHGDIEDALADVAKRTGGFALGALVGKGGTKFKGLDIKRVYFGNWLRDYSQAVDVAGLSKLQLQTIVNLCMALGFLAHGYATKEFEVTEERLGVYLPTEHIDNPKGYPDNARQSHPKLRGPVDPRELEIDPRTGMKNYIANENGPWDTSKGLVRRTLEQCIQLGRQGRATGGKVETYESLRLLGQALHTLEDFPAHSNFCELALVMMGHRDVFVHVGDQVKVRAQNGQWVAPLVTGTFGSDDFIHSLLGEATDHIASVSDLNAELDKARSKSAGQRGGPGDNPVATFRSLLQKIPGGDDQETERELQSMERIRAEPNQPGGKRPEDMSPQELHSVLWQVLTFRDGVVKKIDKTIERIPGLGPLIEKLMDSISVFVFTTLEPFLKPILKQATTGLSAASGEVINSHDQYQVFNDPQASDPTHSFLSKDHFNLILNETAGNLGKIILVNTVNLVVKAWDDTSLNVHQVTEEILQCLFHPEFHDRNSKVQREMLEYMQRWVQSHGHKQHDVLGRLTKDAVRNHRNIRGKGEGGTPAAVGTGAYNAGLQAQSNIQGYVNQIPGVSQAQNLMGKLSGSPGVPGGGAGHSPYGQAQSFLSNFPGMPGGGGGGGGRREAGFPREEPSYGGPPAPSFPGAPPSESSYGAPSAPSFPGAPPTGGYNYSGGSPAGGYDAPPSGNAASYYNPNPSGGNMPGPGHSPYGGPPPQPSYPSSDYGQGGYAPSYSMPGPDTGGYPPQMPQGGPPPPPAGFGFPSPDAAPSGGGYNPSYNPSYGQGGGGW